MHDAGAAIPISIDVETFDSLLTIRFLHLLEMLIHFRARICFRYCR